MTILLFAQIVFVCLLGAMSPGPSMVVVINNAIYKNKIKWNFNCFRSWIWNWNLCFICSFRYWFNHQNKFIFI